MLNEEIQQMIDETVNQTICKLKVANLMKDNNKTAFQKTEELLKNYNALYVSTNEAAARMITRIDHAFDLIKDDSYYQIIPLYYIHGWTRERIAEYFNTSETTISRNKTRLINKLKITLFSSDAIKEIFS